MIHFYFIVIFVWAYAWMVSSKKVIGFCGGDYYDPTLDISWSDGCKSGTPPWYDRCLVDHLYTATIATVAPTSFARCVQTRIAAGVGRVHKTAADTKIMRDIGDAA